MERVQIPHGSLKLKVNKMIKTIKCVICKKKIKIETTGIEDTSKLICKNHLSKDIVKYMMED